jgi:GNAT superfamily N-acetyltransferase
LSGPFTAYLQATHTVAIKFVRDGSILGVGAAICLGTTAWLAHIVVAEEARNQGVGKAIVFALCQRMEAAGMTTVSLLATELGAYVYLQQGFRNLGKYHFYVLEEPVNAEESAVSLRLGTPSDYPALMEMDRVYSGEQREIALLPHATHFLVAEEEGKMCGYYLPEWGDGHIVAFNRQAGYALMAERSKRHLRFSVPDQNQDAIAWLMEHGARMEELDVLRMEWGAAVQWHPEWNYGRIAGKLG